MYTSDKTLLAVGGADIRKGPAVKAPDILLSIAGLTLSGVWKLENLALPTVTSRPCVNGNQPRLDSKTKDSAHTTK
jgi:hypothetical protein